MFYSIHIPKSNYKTICTQYTKIIPYIVTHVLKFELFIVIVLVWQRVLSLKMWI